MNLSDAISYQDKHAERRFCDGKVQVRCSFHTDIAPVTTDGKKQEQDRNPHSHKEHLKLKLKHNVLFP